MLEARNQDIAIALLKKIRILIDLKPCHLKFSMQVSVATVQTDVVRRNDIIVLSKFGKSMRIFDKIDNLENGGVT